jgi:hypothetical protein
MAQILYGFIHWPLNCASLWVRKTDRMPGLAQSTPTESSVEYVWGQMSEAEETPAFFVPDTGPEGDWTVPDRLQ